MAGASLRRDAADRPPVWFGKRPDPITPELLTDQLHDAPFPGRPWGYRDQRSPATAAAVD